MKEVKRTRSEYEKIEALDDEGKALAVDLEHRFEDFLIAMYLGQALSALPRSRVHYSRSQIRPTKHCGIYANFLAEQLMATDEP